MPTVTEEPEAEVIPDEKLYTNEDLMQAASEVAAKHSPDIVMQVLKEDFQVEMVNHIPQARSVMLLRGAGFIKTMARELEDD